MKLTIGILAIFAVMAISIVMMTTSQQNDFYQNILPSYEYSACKNAVRETCTFFADCAVTPIEIIQEKVCNKNVEYY